MPSCGSSVRSPYSFQLFQLFCLSIVKDRHGHGLPLLPAQLPVLLVTWSPVLGAYVSATASFLLFSGLVWPVDFGLFSDLGFCLAPVDVSARWTRPWV